MSKKVLPIRQKIGFSLGQVVESEAIDGIGPAMSTTIPDALGLLSKNSTATVARSLQDLLPASVVMSKTHRLGFFALYRTDLHATCIFLAVEPTCFNHLQI